MKKITGINGFGRVGLHLLKYWLDRTDIANFTISYINDDTLSIQDASNIITTDPRVVFNKYKVSISGDKLIFLKPNGVECIIQYTNEPKSRISWLGKPDILFECSGKNTTRKDCEGYIFENTKLVVISATSWDADKTLIYGFNHTEFDNNLRIISYGSCTVNSCIPLANYIHKKYGIIESDANYIHNIQEYRLKGFNSLNRKFCTLEKSGPNLLGFLNKDNFIVNYTVIPYSGVSMLDFRFKLEREISKEEFIEDLENAFSKGELKHLYDMKEIDTGPEVYNCTTYSAIFIKENIRVTKGNIYLYGYFDNENSVNRYFDLVNYICSRDLSSQQTVSN